ncbi:hypothetical protein [Pseudomonas viridiflava]|uniref:hypothetical protein n=1 Tax=Pseudomonas viridiflava TaxID=33069 RepID=UPI0013DB69D8|nr:hypothetical protein [Pseudomonas viridiflava]
MSEKKGDGFHSGFDGSEPFQIGIHQTSPLSAPRAAISRTTTSWRGLIPTIGGEPAERIIHPGGRNTYHTEPGGQVQNPLQLRCAQN